MEDWKHCPQFAPLADLIRSHGSFAVIAHVHPDGDAIGSTLALGEALKQMGKKVVMMNEDGGAFQSGLYAGCGKYYSHA